MKLDAKYARAVDGANVTNEYKIDSTNLALLNRLIKILNKQYEDIEDLSTIEISFEFIIGSLFPDSWNRILETINEAYTKGFIAGSKI